MPEKKLWYLVCYDVRDEKRLRLVAKRLTGYGSRVQLSIFRCRLTQRSLERLKWELTKIMTPEDDLLIISLCASCADKIKRLHADEKWSEEVKTYEII